MTQESEDAWPVFPSQRRNEVLKLAQENTDAALVIAHCISDHWYGSQSLAWVGRFAPEDRAEEIILGAIDFARGAPDPYRYVAVTAWSLRAFVELNRVEPIRNLLPELLSVSETIPNCASKSEALFLVFQALRPGPLDLWEPAFQALVRASTPTRGWRQRRNLLHAVMIIAEEFSEIAADVPNQIVDQKLKEKIQRVIDERQFGTPRRFFWKVSDG